MGLKARLLKIGISSMLGLTIVLLLSAAWQNRAFSSHAERELLASAKSDLLHLSVAEYHMVKCQDESLRDTISHNIIVADQSIRQMGGVSLSGNHSWKAVNQFSKSSCEVSIPVMNIGGTPLLGNSDPNHPTPAVDKISTTLEGLCTIFQRVNQRGDMLRVATNVIAKNGKRAVGTFIPAVNPDGKPNPVVAAILNKQTYIGMAYVVDNWCVTAYKPLLDSSGKVVGAVFVGIRQENQPSLRNAIVNTSIGKSGYIWVVSAKGETRGRYVMSKSGKRDGEYILDSKDAEGKHPVKEMMELGEKQPGVPFCYEYMWKDSPTSEPKKKIVSAIYYEPWGWLIGASAYEDEFLVPVHNMKASGLKMLAVLFFIGLIAVAIAGYAFNLYANQISDQLIRLTSIAKSMTSGDIQAASDALTEKKD